MAYDLRWSAIATHLPKRTDNEIKNYWNTHLKKRLAKMGIDPVTHKPKSDALSSGDGQAKTAASLSHMAQWESARLEAEARLARESKLRAAAAFQPQPLSSSSSSAPPLPPPPPGNKSVPPPPPPPPCLDVLRAWQGVCSAKPTTGNPGGRIDLESPTSTLSFSENVLPIPCGGLLDGNSMVSHQEPGHELKEEQDLEWKGFENQPLRMLESKDHTMDSFASFSMDATSTVFGRESSSWLPESSSIGTGSSGGDFGEGFTGMLLDNSDDRNSSDGRGDSDNVEGGSCVEEEEEEENKNYWNNILNLVNSASPSSSPPVF